MGCNEGWDNVWRDNSQISGWICPRCEQFIVMYQEHNCEILETEQPKLLAEELQEE
jgi:hypothetical protein